VTGYTSFSGSHPGDNLVAEGVDDTVANELSTGRMEILFFGLKGLNMLMVTCVTDSFAL
jgi:hypothetical protein